MKKIIKKILFRLIGKPYLATSDNYLDWLRAKGIKIGKNTYVLDTTDIRIDFSRPELIEIGDSVFLHRGTVIMSHDWASWAFVNKYSDFLPSHGRVKIGNNVWLGENVTILKNVEIGDNVIIGAGSVVTKSIPSASVAVGCPARVVGSFKDYYDKRKKQYVEEAIEYALAIYENGRTPSVVDFWDDYPVFVDGSNYTEYNYPYSNIFSQKQFEQWKKVHKAQYNGFEEFLKAVNERRKKTKN